MKKYATGDTTYIVENGLRVREAVVLKHVGDYVTVSLIGTDGAIRLRSSRLFATAADAEASLKTKVEKKPKEPRSPHSGGAW